MSSGKMARTGLRMMPTSPSSPLKFRTAGLSGREMARTGLRMMPTSPSTSLRFRTAGFPRYGSKAGLSGSAFPRLAPVKLLPAYPSLALVCIHPSCSRSPHRCSRSESGGCGSSRTAMRASTRSTPGALARVRVVMSRSVLTYSAPSVPLPGTSRFLRSADYTRRLRGGRSATAACEWFRAFDDRSLSACRPLRPRRSHRLHLPSSSSVTAVFAPGEGARRSQQPHHPLQVGSRFRGYSIRLLAATC